MPDANAVAAHFGAVLSGLDKVPSRIALKITFRAREERSKTRHSKAGRPTRQEVDQLVREVPVQALRCKKLRQHNNRSLSIQVALI